MNLEGCGRKRSRTYLRCHPNICAEGLRKITKTLGQIILSPGLNLNPGLPEYEARMSTTRPCLDSSGSGYDPVAGFNEHGDESLGSIKYRVFLTS
jgi:hypothetical protein